MALNLSADGRWLSAGDFEGNINAWDLESGGPGIRLSGLGRQLAGLGVLPDHRTLISTGWELRFWDLPTQAQLVRIDLPTHSFHRGVLSRDGRRLAIGGRGYVAVWDTVSRRELLNLKGPSGFVQVLGFLPDNVSLVAASTEELRMWRATPILETTSERSRASN